MQKSAGSEQEEVRKGHPQTVPTTLKVRTKGFANPASSNICGVSQNTFEVSRRLCFCVCMGQLT